MIIKLEKLSKLKTEYNREVETYNEYIINRLERLRGDALRDFRGFFTSTAWNLDTKIDDDKQMATMGDISIVLSMVDIKLDQEYIDEYDLLITEPTQFYKIVIVENGMLRPTSKYTPGIGEDIDGEINKVSKAIKDVKEFMAGRGEFNLQYAVLDTNEADLFIIEPKATFAALLNEFLYQ
jgi:hypothetical protein